MPDASAEPVCSCAHLLSIAHETAGAARTRHSLHPPIFEVEPYPRLGRIAPRDRGGMFFVKGPPRAASEPKAMPQFVASVRRPEVSPILPCAAALCLMSKLAYPCKRDAGEKRIGAVGAPGRRHDGRPDSRNASGLQVFLQNQGVAQCRPDRLS